MPLLEEYAWNSTVSKHDNRASLNDSSHLMEQVSAPDKQRQTGRGARKSAIAFAHASRPSGQTLLMTEGG